MCVSAFVCVCDWTWVGLGTHMRTRIVVCHAPCILYIYIYIERERERERVCILEYHTNYCHAYYEILISTYGLWSHGHNQSLLTIDLSIKGV